MRSLSSSRNHQGFLLIDLLIWGSVVLSLIVVISFAVNEFDKHRSAQIAGNYIGTVLGAIRAKMTDEGLAIIETTPIGEPIAGVNFLKGAADCPDIGLSDQSYLHVCELPNETELGLSLTTTFFIEEPVPGEQKLFAVVETNQIAAAHGGPRDDLLGEIARTVNSGDFDPGFPTVATYFFATNDLEQHIVRAVVTHKESVDIFLRADGKRDWAAFQNVNEFGLKNVGIISSEDIDDLEPNQLQDGDVHMARFIDADGSVTPGDVNHFALDADKQSRVNDVAVAGDVFIESLNKGNGGFLTDHIIHQHFVATQGDFISEPTCRIGSSPQIHGSLVGVVAEVNNQVPSTNPKAIRGWNVFAEREQGGWLLVAGAFVFDANNVKKFVTPPPELVKIQGFTYCQPG